MQTKVREGRRWRERGYDAEKWGGVRGQGRRVFT